MGDRRRANNHQSSRSARVRSEGLHDSGRREPAAFDVDAVQREAVAGVVHDNRTARGGGGRAQIARAPDSGNIEPLEERTVAGAVEAIDVQDCAPDRHDRFRQQRGERGLAVGDKGGGRRLPEEANLRKSATPSKVPAFWPALSFGIPQLGSAAGRADDLMLLRQRLRQEALTIADSEQITFWPTAMKAPVSNRGLLSS